MKTILVLSDTHKNYGALDKITDIINESDYVIHLGDCFTDMNVYKNHIRGKLITVNGNCDFFAASETERLIEIEDVKIFLCHGHKYGVKSGLDRLKYKAEELNADVCLYGHTHEAKIEKSGHLLIVNPGSMNIMQYKKSYAYLVVNGKKVFAKNVDVL